MTTDSTNMPVISSTITPHMHMGEPRILDTDLAVRLGFTNAAQIRKLIKRHEAALEQLGVVSTVEITSGHQGGRPGKSYYLNKKQAVFITSKSETSEATAITIEVIERFDAYERSETPTVRILKPRTRRPSLTGTFRAGHAIAKMMGYDDNRSGFYAGNYCLKKCGENPVIEMGLTAIPAPSNDRDFTPTQIGEKMGGIKAERINAALIEVGYQTVELDRNKRTYHLTERGKAFGRLNDAAKAHAAGSVQQVRWFETVIPTLTAHFNEAGTPLPFSRPKERAS